MNKHDICDKAPQIASLQAHQKNISKSLVKIEQKLDGLVYSFDKKYSQRLEYYHLENRVKAIESFFGKVVWLVTSTLIISLISLLIRG